MSAHPAGEEEETAIDRKRQWRLGVLAAADSKALMERWSGLELDPAFEPVRGPETGLLMLRGRIGGDGAPFNVGEATVSRASVRLECGTVGHAMALGGDRRKATLCAVIDALAQKAEFAGRIDEALIGPLEAQGAARDEQRAREAAATKVDFFTMVRGEDS